MLLASFSVVTNVALSRATNPLGLSFASMVTVAEEASPNLAPPVTADKLTVKI